MTGPTGVATMICPNCGAAVGEGERFCESCGADLPGGPQLVDSAADGGAPAGSAPADGVPVPTQPVLTLREGVVVAPVDLDARASTCTACGGTIAADGYCEQCGTPAPNPRDHWVDEPAPWVVAVCDRGVRHVRNEDAVAVAAGPEAGSFAVLVVCDGVSSAPDSDQASLGAARAARDVLAAPAPGDQGDAVEMAMAAAGAAAHEAASGVARRVAGTGRGNPPSTTFVAALLEGREVLVGWVGDSRAYWMPDDAGAGPSGDQLSVDDSWAAEAIALGVPREEAETGPNAHAITRWLGADAPDPRPRTARRRLDGAGWLMLCSDGLWNYCSEAKDLAALVAATAERAATPRELAGALVQWAVEQGGADNISVALARVEA
jgi:serine/threonine protein phosphatase PrpC